MAEKLYSARYSERERERERKILNIAIQSWDLDSLFDNQRMIQ